MAWTSPRTWAASEFVTATLLNTHLRDNLTALSDRIQCVYKSADETVTNSAALQNDNELSFTVVAGQKYLFTVNLLVVSSVNTSDIAAAFTFPAGTMNWLGTGLDQAATTTTASMRMAGSVGAASGTSITFGAITSQSGLTITGSYSCTTGGTVQLQWAQGVAAAATDVTVKAGSSLQATRVAV